MNPRTAFLLCINSCPPTTKKGLLGLSWTRILVTNSECMSSKFADACAIGHMTGQSARSRIPEKRLVAETLSVFINLTLVVQVSEKEATGVEMPVNMLTESLNMPAT